MNDNGKQYWANHKGEEDARHVMGAVVVILLAFVCAVAVGLPLAAAYVCALRGGC